MRVIKVKKGISLPFKMDDVTKEVRPAKKAEYVALDLSSFEGIYFSILEKVGARVKIGQPLAEEKECKGRFFVSPGSGEVVEVIRGEKRRPLYVVIRNEGDEHYTPENFDEEGLPPEELLKIMGREGLLPFIKKHPCNQIASPNILPEAVFVKGIDTAPYSVDPSFDMKGYEEEFAKGVQILKKLSSKDVFIVSKEETHSLYSSVPNASCHIAKGPHPSGNVSLHIYHLHPILKKEQVVWSLDVNSVVKIGAFFKNKKHHVEKIVCIGSDKTILGDNRGYYRTRQGAQISSLIGDDAFENTRIISGDPLTGSAVKKDEFLGLYDSSVCLVKEDHRREAFHFFRPGFRKPTITRTYLSGFAKCLQDVFSTHQHGEDRPFVESDIYQKYMPMRIPVMDLAKAILAEDFQRAEELGLLEISPEDFALPAFVCPSKTSLMQIIDTGLKSYAKQYLSE